MKPIEELGTSPAPWWCNPDQCSVWARESYGSRQIVASLQRGPADEANARLIAAAPDLYEALRDCCEEAMGDNVPRCYACRKGKDGHCMAATEKRCAVYAALEKAGGAE